MAYQDMELPIRGLGGALEPVPKWKTFSGLISGYVKNDKGQTTAGDVIFEYEVASFGGSDILALRTANLYMRHSVINNTSNCPICIIAIPIQYGLTGITVNDKVFYQDRLNKENYVEAYHNRQTWLYLIAKDGGALREEHDINWQADSSMLNIYMTSNEDLYKQYPVFMGSAGEKGTSGKSDIKALFSLTKLLSWMQWTNNDPKGNTINSQRFTTQTMQYAGLMDGQSEEYEFAKRITLSLIGSPVEYLTGAGEYSYLQPIMGAKISAMIPIFTIDDVEGIRKYFDDGDDSNAKNKGDLTLSDVNLATDWKVYIKGKQFPSIFVTMESKELNDFLSSEDNKTGLVQSDFKVEYRYRPIEWDYATTPSLLPTWVKKPPTSVFRTDNYNESYTTQWKELGQLVYGEKFEEILNIIKASEFLEEVSGHRVNLQFRIKYNDNIFSSWCYFEIGYIGSPSVPDFSKMNNECGVVLIADGSTVTLIYDDVPPDDDDSYKDPEDDGDVGGDDTKPTDSISVLNLLTTSYRVSDSNVQALGGKLWSQHFWDNIKLLNNSPIENIVGLKIMPCSVNAFPNGIIIGNVDMEIEADVVTSVPVVDVGSFNFVGHYGNFLDYAPYTQASLFLPFIGFVEIDPAQFTGHTLNVKYSFDIIMGQCKAMLFADGIYVQSYEGVCGIDVPLVASNRAQVEGSTVASMASSAVQGDLVGIGTSLMTRQYHSTRAGGYSSTLGWAETRTCFIALIIPNAQYASSYGHDVGYPCNVTCKLGTLSGFTVCGEDIDMSGFTCTEEEKAEIKRLLTEGVYL